MVLFLYTYAEKRTLVHSNLKLKNLILNLYSTPNTNLYMKEKKSYQDWIFANEAGYIGKHFFCYSQNSYGKLIRYEDLTKITITKQIPFELAFVFFALLY